LTKGSNKLYSKTPTQIEKETGRKFIDIIDEMKSKGLSDTEIARDLKLKSPSVVVNRVIARNRKNERKNFDEDKFILGDLTGLKRMTLEKLFKDKLNIEYKDFLYNQYIEEGLSKYEITKLLGISEKAVYRHLKLYRISKTNSQARQDAMSSGRINYQEITAKSRKTMNKIGTNKYNKQEMFRDTIKYHLELNIHKLNINNLEFIVGFNEWGILQDKEIDIPIIIIKDNQFIKISIEYSGNNWHETTIESDQEKQNRLLENNWIHFTIQEVDNESTNITILEDKAIDITNKIINIITDKFKSA
jgi:predicted transcriptional regulator